MPQKGQVLLRFESFAVQPAMISSSYTRQSHVLQSEQLDISTYNKKHQANEESHHSALNHDCLSQSNDQCLIRDFYVSNLPL